MAFCIYCGIEQPEAARFCFKCGKAVSEVDEESTRQMPHAQSVPVIEEQSASNKEHVRIAHSLTSIDEEVAALVLYAHPTAQGTNVSLRLDVLSASPVTLKGQYLTANVVARQAGGRTFYVAVFPRISFLTLEGKTLKIAHARCEVQGLPLYVRGEIMRRVAHASLYPGIITEIDWSGIEYRPDEVEDE